MKDKVKKVKTFVEPSLEVSELRYRRSFEAAQDGILILDARTGAITDANPYLTDMLGYLHHELVDKKFSEIGPFKSVTANKAAFQALPLKANGGHLVQVEFVSNIYLASREKVIQCNIGDIMKRQQAKKVVGLKGGAKWAN
ncbi:MAG: PAS domain S-box protein [Anaerolineales bacterium]